MSYIPGRPLVVIAGWLGCQPRSLRRYEELYRNLGFGVLTRISTPRMVVKASTQTPPCIQYQNINNDAETMQHLTWNVLWEIHTSQCSVVLFHVFSNGGGFFWEQVRNILNTNNEEATTISLDLDELRSKIVGIAFDSCPAQYSPKSRNSLLDALRHCTWTERMGAYAQLAKQMASLSLDDREKRANDYFQGMRDDPWNVRQLYLCSKDDPLSPHGPLEELVTHRQQMFSQDRIILCEWESSPHCGHLLKHPIDYQKVVSAFVEQCLEGDDMQQSKL